MSTCEMRLFVPKGCFRAEWNDLNDSFGRNVLSAIVIFITFYRIGNLKIKLDKCHSVTGTVAREIASK
jgi:hypothetical protein